MMRLHYRRARRDCTAILMMDILTLKYFFIFVKSDWFKGKKWGVGQELSLIIR